MVFLPNCPLWYQSALFLKMLFRFKKETQIKKYFPLLNNKGFVNQIEYHPFNNTYFQLAFSAVKERKINHTTSLIKHNDCLTYEFMTKEYKDANNSV